MSKHSSYNQNSEAIEFILAFDIMLRITGQMYWKTENVVSGNKIFFSPFFYFIIEFVVIYTNIINLKSLLCSSGWLIGLKIYMCIE